MEKINLIISLYGEDPAEPAFSLLRGLFAVCALCSGPGLTVLQPAPGIVLQLVGRAAQPPAYLRTGPILSYGVDNLAYAVALAESRGASILQEITDDCRLFFLLPAVSRRIAFWSVYQRAGRLLMKAYTGMVVSKTKWQNFVGTQPIAYNRR